MITKTQLANRAKHLGSTDIVALFGLHPKLNAYDIYLEKSGKLTEADQADDKWISRGNYMEPSLIMFAEELLGRIKTTKQEFSAANGLIVSHPDGQPVKIPSSTLEAKSVGPWANEKMIGDEGKIVTMPAAGCWGDENTDSVPHRVTFQAQVHILCTGAEVCYVPAYLPYREFVMFAILRNMAIIESILEEAHRFWEKNVKADTPPENILPALETIKRIKHRPEKVVPISSEVARVWDDARNSRLEAKAKEDLAETALRAAIGDADAGQFEGGMVVIQHISKKGFVMPAVKYTTPRMVKK